MLKKILQTVVVLVLIISVAPIFLPAKVSMSRSIEIQAPVAIVYSKLTNLNEYNKWNPFPEGDSTNQTKMAGEGIGSTLTWTGERTGEGKMTVIAAEPEKRVDVKMEFYKPMSGEGMVHWITSAKTDSSTELTWTFEQDLSYFNRYFGLMMDSMMGKHFEKGLLNYKALVETSR